jgi:hypothetical protein
MLTDDTAFLLKIWVYRQDGFTIQQHSRWKYNPFAASVEQSALAQQRKI